MMTPGGRGGRRRGRGRRERRGQDGRGEEEGQREERGREGRGEEERGGGTWDGVPIHLE